MIERELALHLAARLQIARLPTRQSERHVRELFMFQRLRDDWAVAILTLQAVATNRLAVIDYPCWARRDGTS